MSLGAPFLVERNVMSPEELFSADPASPWWVHGEYIGVDEGGGLWVKADADLKADLASRVSVLGKPLLAMDARHFTILTSGRKTGLNPRDRSEPVWKHVTELKTGSIGPGWIAVD